LLEPEGLFSMEFLIANNYHKKMRNPIPGTLYI
jgi:hypothetical protein